MSNIEFEAIDWSGVPKIEYSGETGKVVYWQTKQYEGIRVRIVEYSENYLADHWCQRGHIVHCLEGSFISEEQNGTKIKLTKGMSYIVSDQLSSHKSYSENGAKLLIIDGDFLKLK